MKHKTLSFGCVLIAVLFLLCTLALLPQPQLVRAQPVTNTLSGFNFPDAVAMVPLVGGVYAYVTNLGGASVSVIDTSASPPAPVAGSWNPISVGTWPDAVALVYDGGNPFVYVANEVSGSVSIINVNNQNLGSSAVSTVNLGTDSDPMALAYVNLGPTSQHVYVADYGTGSVSLINAQDPSATPTTIYLDINFYPIAVAYSPFSGDVWILSIEGDNGVITMINPSVSLTNHISAVLPLPSGTPSGIPSGMTIDPNGDVYVSYFASSSVSVYQYSSMSMSINLMTTIYLPAGTYPGAMSVVPYSGTNYVYVSNSPNGAGNTVSVIDTTTDGVTGTITLPSTSPAGSDPVDAVVVGASISGAFDNEIYVPTYGGNQLLVINPTYCCGFAGSSYSGSPITAGYENEQVRLRLIMHMVSWNATQVQVRLRLLQVTPKTRRPLYSYPAD